jgi:hypothetical protein
VNDKEVPATELDALCKRLLKARSRTQSAETEPGSDGVRSVMQELRLFSQGDEEQNQAVVFDVVYEPEPTVGKMVESEERPTLRPFDTLSLDQIWGRTSTGIVIIRDVDRLCSVVKHIHE